MKNSPLDEVRLKYELYPGKRRLVVRWPVQPKPIRLINNAVLNIKVAWRSAVKEWKES